MKNLISIFLLLLSAHTFAQLGFCEGSKGDFIFHEDFGQGNVGVPLPAGVTTYTYVTGRDPDDGFYTISTRLGITFNSWHNRLPSTTISNGLALIVNADDANAGRFYEIAIPNLCENTSYEFSAYLMNVHNKSSGACNNQDIPINVRFEIWEETNTRLLKQGITGNINSTATPTWKQYALTFRTEPGQGSVILKMFNEGVGGCGNDLAIDDIIFRSCGDFTAINSNTNAQSPLNVCESSLPASFTLTATPDFTIYNQHNFQWQESVDNQTWFDITGETKENFATSTVTTSKYYRVKVAEDAQNLNNNLCSTVSESFEIKFIETPEAPLSNGDKIICSNDELPALSVTVASGETVNWYDAPQNGNLLAEGSSSYFPQAEGIYYAEARKLYAACPGSSRTAVRLKIFEALEVQDEIRYLCEEGSVELDAGVENMTYEWSTGETNQIISTSASGNFRVLITTKDGCTTPKNFEVQPVDIAGIIEVVSEENAVIISPLNSGTFEYSLDGINFQLSNRFEVVPAGVYTAYIRDLSACKTEMLIFPHLVIPRYFTPNGDGHNDFFQLRGTEFFTSSFIRIFDRYGKLIRAEKGENFLWDGTYKGEALPAADYWYEINIEDFKIFKGHISLIR